MVASGELSAFDLVRAHLDRIHTLDPRLNAFVDLRADAALGEARAQDAAAARGATRGPLGGLPVTVKSAIEVAGLRCETGSPSRAGIVAAHDALVVSRLKAAGAIVIGTTNVAEMLMAMPSSRGGPTSGSTSIVRCVCPTRSFGVPGSGACPACRVPSG